MRCRHWRLGLALAGLMMHSQVATAAATFLDGSLQLNYLSNMNNADLAVDREDGFVTAARVSVKRREIIAPKWGVQYGARLEADWNTRFSNLNRGGLGLNGRLHWKPVVGYTKPWFALDADVVLSQFSDSDIRDGIGTRFTLMSGARVTQKLSARVGYVFDWRTAFGGRAFDNRGHGLFAAFSFKPSKRLVFYGRYDARVGDVVSTAVPNNPVIAAAEVIEQDDAYGLGSVASSAIGPGPGPGPGLLNNNTRFAYRIDAVSHQGRVGANYAITPAMSVDVSGRYRATYGDGNNDYFGFNIQGALLYRF